MLGQIISHYRIDEKLGEGGMGVVYRATDLSLNRPVAIKFLSPGVADAERRRRFQQEAQTASSLNHPHILTVFEAGTTEEDQQYLVTEFIDGWNLREWTNREQPAVKQLVELLLGVADGLAAAHQAGIVHRDIKPENILVAKNGYAKLVDFGLAKLLETTERGPEGATLSAGPTRPGVILGTVAYMAPEQALGKPVDARTDVFSFGVVLYELLAGRRPFTGQSDIDVLHAVVHSAAPPLAEARPAELRTIIEKALEKDPNDRFQSTRDLVVDLRRVQRLKAAPATAADQRPEPKRRGRRWAAFAAGAAVVLGLATGAWWARRSDFFWQNPLANAQFTRLTDWEGTEFDAAISGDGKFVAFLSDRDGVFDVWLSQLGTGEFINLTKGRFGDVTQPTRGVGFSGDGAHVWFGAMGSKVLVPALGGNPRPFLKAVMLTWSGDGQRLAYHSADGDPIFVADRNGNNPRKIFADTSEKHCHYLAWSPDNRYIYFARGDSDILEMDVWRVSTDGGEPERITRQNTDPRYLTALDNRTLLYTAPAEDGSGPWLWAVDVERRAPRRVTVGLEHYLSVAASADGRRLVATVASPAAGLWSIPIADRPLDESAAQRVALPTVRARAPRHGPDYFAYLSSKGGGDGIWKFQKGVATELWKASEGAVGNPPAVSADGRQICFSVRKQGRTGLFVMTSDGTGVRPLAESLDVRGGAAWSPDGNWIAVGGFEGKRRGLFKAPAQGGAPQRLADGPFSNPVWSPDGALVVYAEATVGRLQRVLAVRPDGTPFSLPQVSPDPEQERFVRSASIFSGSETAIRVRSEGERVRFLPDGKRLVLMQGVMRWQQFWLLDLATGGAQRLTNLRPGFTMRTFDVSPDGKQILFDRVRENSDIVMIELARK